MDVRLKVTFSVGILIGGYFGLGLALKDRTLMGYLKWKNGPHSVKYQTCLNVNEIAKLNLENALGCKDGKPPEKSREFTLPTAPITLSAATKGDGLTMQLKATRKQSLRRGIEAESSLSVEIWDNKPEQRKPTASPNWPLYQQPTLWGAKSGQATVPNESLSPIEKYWNEAWRRRQTVAGTRAFTPVSDADVQPAPADVYIRIADAYSSILERNNRPFSGIAGTTTR